MPSSDASDTAHSALVSDHAYRPKRADEPWGLCAICNLGESTHQRTVNKYSSPDDLPYHCPDCVTVGAEVCTHR